VKEKGQFQFSNLERSGTDKVGRSAVEDAACFVDFALKTLGVAPEHVTVMAEQTDFSKIVREFKDWKGSKNTIDNFHLDAPNDEEHGWWLEDP
jgi:hypothetical protein